jgi:hypothetical protein
MPGGLLWVLASSLQALSTAKATARIAQLNFIAFPFDPAPTFRRTSTNREACKFTKPKSTVILPIGDDVNAGG